MKRLLSLLFLCVFSVLFSTSLRNEKNENRGINSLGASNDVELTFFSDYGTTISRTFSNYDYNPNGICGSVSAAIILQYYDDYLDDNILPEEYENNEILTISKIMPYIDHINNFTAEGGSDVFDMTNGLNSYLGDNNINSKSFTYKNFSTSTYKSCIKSNKPVIIDLDEHPKYKEHWVVGYGYYIEQRKLTHIICLDGWGNNYVLIPISYIGYIVF